MTRDLFVADLHLSTSRPAARDRFLGFLAHEAAGARALYILGDLFEYWIGDDELDAPAGDTLGQDVAAALRHLALRGTAVHIMHGNRDFLLGTRFCEAAGAHLIADPCLIETGGQRTLLMHGDTLCTDDHEYLAWRGESRSVAWRSRFLAQPALERHRLAGALREQSRARTRTKAADIMDVNGEAVAAALQESGAGRLIHGHTHRPAQHSLQIDGTRRERWVLPDWYETGGYLVVGDELPHLVSFAVGEG